ncbi:MAG TPA: hypothetical protein VK961_26875 [Chthoniobacter sp.]|nr:hypothetical protein [Chthoniobacter sp.]
MDRALFTGGPAYLVFDGVTFQLHDDWKVDLNLQHFDVKTNLQGTVAKAISENAMAKVTAIPIAFGGSISTAFAKLLPYQPSMRGQFIFPASDKPLVIQTAAGKSITFAAAALTKMPEITFAPDKIFFGAVEFTCLIANLADPSDDDAFLTIADSAYTEPALDPLDILFDIFTGVFGASPSAPFDGIETDENGFKFTPTVKLTPRKTAKNQTYNFMIDDVTAMVKFTPENVSEEDWKELIRTQGAGYGVGKLRGSLGDILTIAGSATGKPRLTIPLAAGEDGGLRFAQNSRVGEVTLAAHRKLTSVSKSTGTTSASKSATVGSTTGLTVGMAISGTGISAGTTIAKVVDGTTLTLSANATATGTATLTYKSPLFALDIVPA